MHISTTSRRWRPILAMAGVCATFSLACHSPPTAEATGEFGVSAEAVVTGGVTSQNGDPLDSADVVVIVRDASALYFVQSVLTDRSGAFLIVVQRAAVTTQFPFELAAEIRAVSMKGAHVAPNGTRPNRTIPLTLRFRKPGTSADSQTVQISVPVGS